MNTATITNSTNTANTTHSEERLASSATVGMLGIVTAAMLLTAVAGSGDMLMVLALPASLFALSLAKEKSRFAARDASNDHATVSAVQTKSSAEKSDSYFPSWLGSSAYSAACAGKSDRSIEQTPPLN